jgi:proline iminopeptidase
VQTIDLIQIATVASTVISAIGIIVALLAVWVQTKQNNRALGVTILRELEDEFLWSDEMRRKRSSLARYLLDRKPGDPSSPDVGYMLDFFDSMGLYHNKGVIDTEMSWVMFYYWFGHYWQLLKEDARISEQYEDGIAYYKNVRLFYQHLTEFGRKERNLPREEQYYSPENLQAFLLGELKRCSTSAMPSSVEHPRVASSKPVSVDDYVSVTGGRLWYRMVGRGPRTPLLVIHGGPGYPHNYLTPLEALADTRAVIFYDQLGCGKSDWPDNPRLWTVERFQAEVEELRAALGLEKFHVLGHSWGSILAVEYSLAHPHAVRSLVLASPCLSAPRWAEDASLLIEQLPDHVKSPIYLHQANGTVDSEEYAVASREYDQRYVCRVQPYPAPMRESRASMNSSIYADLWGPSEFFLTGTLKSYDCTGRLCELPCPVLFTCGQYDEATPGTTNWYSSLVPHSDVVVFENSAHMPHLEETGRYIEVLRKYLDRADTP